MATENHLSLKVSDYWRKNNMPKITIIDGNSLLFRAYFATAYPGVEIMRGPDGTPTNAIFAFSNMLNKIVHNLKEGEGIIVAFDAAKHNFRHDVLETYKANRKPAPEDLVKQFPLARDFLRAFGIFQFEEEGFEGDDIAGTIAKKAEEAGYDVIIYTSDRDFLQLVTDKITVNIIRKGLSDVVAMTPALVKETYGFEPKQIIDYKGLRGDSSDNLPGIPGIGEKTAVKLIQEYGSFDNIVANVENLTGKVKQMIIENQDLGRTSRDLAIIKTNIDIPFTVEDTIYEGYSFTSINEFCQKYGLKQFMNKIDPKWKRNDNGMPNITVNKIDSFKDLSLSEDLGIALDYENPDDYFRSDILGIALTSKNETYYIDYEDAKKDEILLEVLKNPKYKKYVYDYKAMKVCLHNHDIELNGLCFDLLIASYLLDTTLNNQPETVLHYYGVDLSDEQEEMSLFSNANPQKSGELSHYCLFLAGRAKAELVKISTLDLYNNLELPLVNTLADMEIEGFPLDVKTLDEIGASYREKVDSLSKEIYELAGEQFNLASPKQVADILYNKLGLPDKKKGSTAVEVLNDLVDKHPIIDKILEYRKYFKLVTTYIDGLKPHVYKDGKIHASFNQALTQTGRLSSSNPNLQNISVRDEEGKNIRKAFYYPNHEYEILSLDYSQIELRILAHLANCPALKAVFESGEDIHAATAKKVFKLDREPNSLERRKAKAVNFGIIYGISDWGLSEQLEIPLYESKEIINNFYDAFPEVAVFFKKVVDDALKNGYVSTMHGRRRYLRELHDSNYQTREFAKRAAMNAPIQGSAADLIKIAMIEVDKALKEAKLESKMVLQIHDELIIKVAKSEKDVVYNLVKNKMTHALNLSVPLEVDGGFGDSWYDTK